ncbi:MAG: hypothetical protein M0Z42_21110 [Actinomycetota bacterium]|nr:hypothetical protein [Actinomycetota bacterium]
MSTADIELGVVVVEADPDGVVVVDLDADAVGRPAAAPVELEHPASTHMPARAAITIAPPSRRPCRIGADLPGRPGQEDT